MARVLISKERKRLKRWVDGDKDHGIGDNVVGNKEEGLSKGNVMVGHRDNFTSKSALGVDINGK